MAERTCSVDGCDKPYLARGWCGTHYRRWYITAPAGAIKRQRPRPRRDAWERFQEKFEPAEHGCWRWTAADVPEGYGTFWEAGKSWIAPRWSWTHANGPIPDGHYIDHFRYPGRCIGPACVRPDHLRPVLPRESVLRSESQSARSLARTHCPKGHAYDEENTRYVKGGHRQCRACDRVASVRKARRANPNPKVPETQRTHCPRGHAYDEANTYLGKNGSRTCRACGRILALERYHRKKLAG